MLKAVGKFFETAVKNLQFTLGKVYHPIIVIVTQKDTLIFKSVSAKI